MLLTERTGEVLRLENDALNSLKKQIRMAKAAQLKRTIDVVIKDKIYKVSGIRLSSGSPKSDFELLNSNGNPCVWISHKGAKAAYGFQQWGGLSKLKEPKIFAHEETQRFLNDLKEMYPSGLSPRDSLIRRIHDPKLKMMSCYGNAYGSPKTGPHNVDLIIHGKQVNLIEMVSSKYIIQSHSITYNGTSFDGTPYEPVFVAMYRGPEANGKVRSDSGILNSRIVIYPLRGRAGKEI